MANYVRTDSVHWAKNFKEACWMAASYVLTHKKTTVVITDAKQNLTGIVYYVGPKTGPVYYSEKKQKKYLLDYDGSLFDYKTKKRV